MSCSVGQPRRRPKVDRGNHLGWFKDRRGDADSQSVSDDYSWRTRVHRDPSSDNGGQPARPAFQFDLGGALAKLGDDSPAAPAAAVASTPAAPVPPARPIADHTPAEGNLRPYATPRSSVFEDAAPAPQPSPQVAQPARAVSPPVVQPPAPSPVVVAAPVATAPSVQPMTVASRVSVFEDDTPPPVVDVPRSSPPVLAPQVAPAPMAYAPAPAPQFPNPVMGAPVLSSHGAATAVLLAEPPTMAVTTDAVPYLPAPTPVSAAVPASATQPESASASVADVKAFKAAQMRASRQQRKGKMFGRSVLAFAVIGGLVGAALYFGRSYLFPAEWDPELVAAVDEIQAARGAELDRTIPLVVQSADEYAATVAGVLGDGWAERLPEWRALGLAAPEVSAESVGATLAARFPVVYDSDTDTIYRSADADPAAIGPDIRMALESAFARAGDGDAVVVETPALGFAGLSSPQRLAERAVDSQLAGRVGAPVAGSELPVPLAYEVAVIEALGEPILRSVGADPATTTFGDYPDAIYGALSDEPTLAAAGPLQPGDTPRTDAVALGVDDWSLVWGVHLRPPTVEQVANVVTADSFRTFERNGVVCASGMFETASEADAAVVLGSLQNWAVLAPSASQAAATQVGPTQVQLTSCDSGSAAVQPDLAMVDDLVARQAARLAG